MTRAYLAYLGSIECARQQSLLDPERGRYVVHEEGVAHSAIASAAAEAATKMRRRRSREIPDKKMRDVTNLIVGAGRGVEGSGRGWTHFFCS